VRDRIRVRNRVRDRDRLSVKQLGGELLHQRLIPHRNNQAS